MNTKDDRVIVAKFVTSTTKQVKCPGRFAQTSLGCSSGSCEKSTNRLPNDVTEWGFAGKSSRQTKIPLGWYLEDFT